MNNEIMNIKSFYFIVAFIIHCIDSFIHRSFLQSCLSDFGRRDMP